MTSTPRRRRSRPRWNGRCRRAAAPAARAPAVSRARKKSLRSLKKAHRAAASACSPKAARRCAKARCCLRIAASSEPIGKVTSGGFGPSLNAPVAMGYLPTSLSAERARRSLPKCAASACRCRSLPCPSSPTPTNADHQRTFHDDVVHIRPRMAPHRGRCRHHRRHRLRAVAARRRRVRRTAQGRPLAEEGRSRRRGRNRSRPPPTSTRRSPARWSKSTRRSPPNPRW